MIIESFYLNGKHYTWNDLDCVYYNDKTDEEYYTIEGKEEALRELALSTDNFKI